MHRPLLHLTTLALLVATLAWTPACLPDREVGEACTSQGDGFTQRDPCKETCVDWEITCPNGLTLVPDSCSGQVCGATGECPSGQVCVQIDSFVANSRCMAAEVCGAAPVGATAEAAPGALDVDMGVL